MLSAGRCVATAPQPCRLARLRSRQTSQAAAAARPPSEAPGPVRERISQMSSEVVDSNPYSRLMALQRMGIVKDYERIRDKTVGGKACRTSPGGDGGGGLA